MSLAKYGFGLAVVFAVVTGAVIGTANADQDCSECRALHDDIGRLKDQVSDLNRDVDALQRQARSGQSSDDRDVAALRKEVDQLQAHLASAEQEIRRMHGPRSVRLVVTHSLTYTGGTQHCDRDEVVTSYTHREGDSRIQGDCAEVRLE